MLWGFISSTLFDIYEKIATPAMYINPDRSNANILAMIGFVDESNGQINRFLLVQDIDGLQWLVEKAT